MPVVTLSSDELQFEDTGLRALTVYAYTVVAFDEAGNESVRASSSQTRTGGVPTPAGLSAEDGTGRIELAWQAVDDEDLIGYNVYRSSQPDLSFGRLGAEASSSTTGETTYIDSGLSAGQLFFYKVSAVTTQGESEPSGFVRGALRRPT